MQIKDASVGLEVVRSIGDYVVGRTGTVLNVDYSKNRVRVDWKGNTNTWVNTNCVEPLTIPYKIIPASFDKAGRRTSWAKYNKL